MRPSRLGARPTLQPREFTHEQPSNPWAGRRALPQLDLICRASSGARNKRVSSVNIGEGPMFSKHRARAAALLGAALDVRFRLQDEHACSRASGRARRPSAGPQRRRAPLSIRSFRVSLSGPLAMPPLERPRIARAVFDIRAEGAVAHGKTKATAAIAQAHPKALARAVRHGADPRRGLAERSDSPAEQRQPTC
jgi:hypothetical protein